MAHHNWVVTTYIIEFGKSKPNSEETVDDMEEEKQAEKESIEIKSNINLATMRQRGDLLDPLIRSTDRTVNVKKFLRQFFVDKKHSFKVTKSMLGTMVEHQILAPRTIRCGLLKMWKSVVDIFDYFTTFHTVQSVRFCVYWAAGRAGSTWVAVGLMR